MKKTDKKIESTLVSALTDVCELALQEIEGFKWITHLVDYRRFPDSLVIVCVFDSNDHLSALLAAGKDQYLRRLINEKLTSIPQLKHHRYQLKLDSEEACAFEHSGKWHQRLSL